MKKNMYLNFILPGLPGGRPLAFDGDGGEVEIKTIEQVHEAVGALRAEFEKQHPNFEKIELLEKAFDGYEAKNQEIVAAQKAAEKEALDLKESVDGLESEIARLSAQPGEGKNYKDSEAYKALNEFCVKGRDGIDLDQKQLLRTDSDVSGGFLVVSETDNVITKKIIEISGVRQISRVRTVGRKSLEMPKRNTIPTATFEGEAEQNTEDTSTYESETVTAFRQTVTVPITQDMLMDASFDMESEIMGDTTESFAQGEGLNFVVGDGFKKPEGFTVNAEIVAAARNSETSGTINADDILLLTGDLKTGYNPTYVLNRRTLAFLRTLKSTDGNFLWMPGLNGVVASTLAGFPYMIANDMPDIAANAFPLAFGDFMRGYTIIDRTGMTVIRDEVTLARKAIVNFTIHRWLTGQVTLAEAITLLKVTP